MQILHLPVHRLYAIYLIEYLKVDYRMFQFHCQQLLNLLWMILILNFLFHWKHLLVYREQKHSMIMMSMELQLLNDNHRCYEMFAYRMHHDSFVPVNHIRIVLLTTQNGKNKSKLQFSIKIEINFTKYNNYDFR